MKPKIICILLTGLLIATTLPAIGVTIKTIGNDNSPPVPNGAVDQEQTSHGGSGMNLRPGIHLAQSFKPSKENLTNVQLWLFKYGDPPAGVEITVYIRTALDGDELTAKTINADDVGIAGSGTWVPFNFDDIIVTPEGTYYIVCIASDGAVENCYCWLFDIGDKYTRGEAWISLNSGGYWETLSESAGIEDPDFCFKTYFKESRDKSINKSILNLLKNYPNLFKIMEKLLQRLEL
jgi:hypothetical protein